MDWSKKPVCKDCEAAGRKYSVSMPMGGVTTLMAVQPGYWDEDGKYIPPDNPNHTTYYLECSNGHSWSVVQ